MALEVHLTCYWVHTNLIFHSFPDLSHLHSDDLLYDTTTAEEAFQWLNFLSGLGFQGIPSSILEEKPERFKSSTGVRVRNIVGSSVVSGNHKAYWIKKMKGKADWPETCCAKGCTNPAVHGGHVQLDSHLWTWSLVPVCQNPHNKPSSATTFQVNSGTWVVVEDRADILSHIKSWTFAQRG